MFSFRRFNFVVRGIGTRHGNAADATRIRSPRAKTLSGTDRRDRWRVALELRPVPRSVRSLVGGFAEARRWRRRSCGLSRAQYSCAVAVVLLRTTTRRCPGAIELSPDRRRLSLPDQSQRRPYDLRTSRLPRANQ